MNFTYPLLLPGTCPLFLNFTHPLFLNFTHPLFMNFTCPPLNSTHPLFMYFTPVPIQLTRTSRPTLWYLIVICLIAISIVITYYVQFLLRIEFEGVFFVGNNHMCTLAQYNPKVSQGAVSYNMSNLQQLHVFQFGHSTGRLQNKPQQVHVHVFQFDRFNVQKMYCYQVTFSSASLCILCPPVVC